MPEDKKKHFLERCYAQSERMTKLLLDMSALTKLDEMDDSRTDSRSAYLQVTSVLSYRMCSKTHRCN